MNRERLIQHAIVYIEKGILMLDEAEAFDFSQEFADLLKQLREARRRPRK